VYMTVSVELRVWRHIYDLSIHVFVKSYQSVQVSMLSVALIFGIPSN
jgi:hypothetical protein